jgi:hypothetical protein
MPNPLEEDREILRQFQQSLTPRENFDEGTYVYCAEYIGKDGIYIHQAKSIGWEPISKDMPENPMLRDASGYCTMGDVMFMRMPIARWKQLERAQQAIIRETLGEKNEEQTKREIDDKISQMVGHQVKMSFEFKDQRELTERKH